MNVGLDNKVVLFVGEIIVDEDIVGIVIKRKGDPESSIDSVWAI